jgi:hypothetical protein
MFLYPFALLNDPTFFFNSLVFTSTAAIALPADFKNIKAIQLDSGRMRQARICSNREYPWMNVNPRTQGTTDNPLATLQQTTIAMTPANSGTLFYNRRPRELVAGTDDAFEISLPNASALPLIPWIYEEGMFLKAMDYARERHNLVLDLAQADRQQLERYAEAGKALAEAEKPMAVWQREIETPR